MDIVKMRNCKYYLYNLFLQTAIDQIFTKLKTEPHHLVGIFSLKQ